MVERYRPDDYVGYRRPPRHSRFKKGQSGNPNGPRRREPATGAKLVAEELQSTVVVTENGERLRTDKFALLVKQAVNQGIKGKIQPLTLLMKILDSLERLNKTPTSVHPRKRPDLSKMSLEEKQKMLNELISNSKPRDQY
jgi:hypothetical protein